MRDGGGTRTLTDTPITTSLMGCLTKNKTDNPRSLGAAAFLTNASGVEYRLTHFAYVLDMSGLLPGESAQSDNGFTVLPPNEYVSLNSGEEALMTHRDDATSADRGVDKIEIPSGGIALLPGYKLSVGSVTSIFPSTGGEAKIVENTRLADDAFMRMCYKADFVRADNINGPRLSSYRSPYRDRSFVVDPARVKTPYTDFKNTSSKVVNIYGLGIFYSTSTVTQPSDQEVDILVNGKIVDTIKLPIRRPGLSTANLPMILPKSLQIQPGDVFSARGSVRSSIAIVFDVAFFLFADEGLSPVNEKLDIIGVDLNGDGYNDIIDMDEKGSIWVSLRVGAGLQDTQQEWARSIKRVSSIRKLTMNNVGQSLTLQATNADGLCVNLASDPLNGRFIIDYCSVNGNPSLPDGRP